MQAWLDFLNAQEKHLGKEAVSRWLKPLKVLHFDSGNLYLEANNSFQVLWFEEHVRPLIKKGFVNNNNRNIKVHISCSEENAPPPLKQEKKSAPQATFSLSQDTLNPHYTMDQFVPGKNNAIPFQLLTELTQSATNLGSLNPIVLHGASGTGKTHLLMALTHTFQKKGLKAIYVRTETFTDHVVSAIRNSEMQTFRAHYRNTDILLCDDIHLLARRTATQEEFFHTFNTLHMSGKQLIFSSHLPPSLLEEIEPRLISRFEWGIQLHLDKLQKEEAKEALIKRCAEIDCSLAPGAIDCLIEAFGSSLSSIDCALNALILRTHMSGKNINGPLSRQAVETLLKDLIEEKQHQALTPHQIIAAAASYFGIRTEDILGKSHAQEFALPRQVAMHLCRAELQLPFIKIGTIFSRDHSTVMSSVKMIQKRLDQFDGDINSAVTEIRKALEKN